VSDPLDRLFEHIVRTFAMRDEVIGIDLSASASDRGSQVEAEKTYVERREADHARQMRESFRAGLTASYALQQNGRELRLSDQDPVENSVADALIRYLVSFDLARSRTEEVGPLQYIYYLTVDWERLREIAREIGFDLDDAIEASR
jgi:hypothetical protein